MRLGSPHSLFGRRVITGDDDDEARPVKFTAGKEEHQEVYWRCSGTETIGATLLPAGADFTLHVFNALKRDWCQKDRVWYYELAGKLRWDVL